MAKLFKQNNTIPQYSLFSDGEYSGMVSGKSSAQAEIQLLAHFLQAVIDHAFCAFETEPSQSNVTQISYIWKQWKKPRKGAKSLIQLGFPEWQAWAVSNRRKAYWHMAKNGHVQRAIATERFAQRGYRSILELYEHALMRLNRCIPNGTYGLSERSAR